MGLEIQKKKGGSLKSNWWYGRFTIELQDIEKVWSNLPQRRKRSALWKEIGSSYIFMEQEGNLLLMVSHTTR